MRKLSFIHLVSLIVLLFSFLNISAQKPVLKTDSIPKAKAFNLDSLKQTKTIFKVDSNALKKRIALKKNVSETLPKVFGVVPYLEKEKPRIVFIRSLLLPGWGQITNKQYYKLPIVYGAAGVGGYFIYLNNKKCKQYVGYLETIRDTKVNEISITVDGNTRGPFSKDLINNAAKQYRRWKQGTIIGFSAGWLLFAIDANVAAHLKGFDMSDDISATIKPSILNVQGQSGVGLTLKLNLD